MRVVASQGEVGDTHKPVPENDGKARCLTRPAPAAISPTRPEFAKTASLPMDAPFHGQGRSSAADLRFTFHASRFTAAGSDARTPPEGFCNILSLRGCRAVCYTDRHRAMGSFRFHFLQFGETMATGREKDRKTRKKHRKNVARVKVLATAGRSKAKKSKKG